MEKTCRECGVELIVGENWMESGPRRSDYICRNCDKVRSRAWREAHPDYQKAYNEARKEKQRAYDKRRYQEHKKEILAQNKAYHEAHREEIAARKKKYYESHKEELRARRRAYYKAHKEEEKAYGKAWREANPDKVAVYSARRRARKANNRTEPYDRSVIFAQYDGECVYCGAPAEHIDHIVPISEGGADAPDNVVPACAHCNLTKDAQPLGEWLAGHQLKLI